jgi:hypothetical protein
MKSLIAFVFFFATVCSAQFRAATNMQQNPFTTCVYPSCNPGGEKTPVSTINEIVTTKGFDGDLLLGVSGPEYSNALFFQKIGATKANYLVAEWNVYLSKQTADNAQALEYDTFAFNAPYEFMWGSECVNHGYWQVWDQLQGQWVNTPLTCNLATGWHRIQWFYHRVDGDTSCDGFPCEYYDMLNVDGNYTQFNLTYPSSPIPEGWGNTSGLQMQLDISASGKSLSEYVRNVSLIELGN